MSWNKHTYTNFEITNHAKFSNIKETAYIQEFMVYVENIVGHNTCSTPSSVHAFVKGKQYSTYIVNLQ